MKPTIYTIAAKAGVSIATVSRALNNGPRISEETRQRILQIARELGYQPSASARSLALNRTEALALILPQISGPYYSEFIRGAESVTRAHHYHLLIYSSFDVDQEDALLRFLPTRTDGIIVGTYASQNAYIRRLYDRKFPFLLLGHPAPEGCTISTVRPDNEAGAYRLTRHLIERHGFRQIAFICGPDYRTHSRERQDGYRRALLESGLPLLPQYVAEGDFSEASGYAAAQQLLDLRDAPQAIFAGNDQMAIGVLAAINQCGLRVPEDLAVVGFDDIPAARYLQPSLTTVDLEIFDQGVKAIDLLLAHICDPAAPVQEIVIPTTLVVRRSCGCTDE
ncbi:MAG: LacI family DNA-binding transcriptional regulator [Chloroflexota bacterium]